MDQHITVGIMQSVDTILSALQSASDWSSARATCDGMNMTFLAIPAQAKEDAIGPTISSQM